MDLKIDPTTNDLVIEGGDFVFVDGIEEIAQAIRIHLLTFAGEWFLDDTIGWMDFDGMPFGRGSNLNAIRTRVQSEIQAVEGVLDDPPVEITEFRYEPATRNLRIGYRAHCTAGPVVETVDVVTL